MVERVEQKELASVVSPSLTTVIMVPLRKAVSPKDLSSQTKRVNRKQRVNSKQRVKVNRPATRLFILNRLAYLLG